MSTPYHGKNQYRAFLKAGKIITAKIAKLPGVVGILGTGSIGRRFGDRHSDLDLLVYAHGDKVLKLRKLISYGWISWKNMEYDIAVVSYEKALQAPVPSKFWTQLARWDHQNSQILFDSKQRLKNLLHKKLIYSDREQRALLKKYGREVHEFLIYYPEMWAERGNLYNVIDALFRAVQNIILWIYARNKVFEPYVSKWLFYHLEQRSIPEHVCLSDLTRIYLSPPRNLKAAMHRRKKLIGLCSSLGLEYKLISNDDTRKYTAERWEKLPEASRHILSW